MPDLIRLHYNQTTHITVNTEGVDIKPPGNFGDTEAIEYLNHDNLPGSIHFIFELYLLWNRTIHVSKFFPKILQNNFDNCHCFNEIQI